MTKLSDALFQLKNTHLDRQYKLPEKPRDGDLALFDEGVVLPEGGLYYYNGSDWVFIA